MHAPRYHRSPHRGGNQLFPPRDLEQDCHEDQLVGKMPSSPGQAEGWMDAGVCSGRAMKAGTRVGLEDFPWIHASTQAVWVF